jgi:hypothetical protein
VVIAVLAGTVVLSVGTTLATSAMAQLRRARQAASAAASHAAA